MAMHAVRTDLLRRQAECVGLPLRPISLPFPAVRIYVDSWNAGFGSRMPTIKADAARISRWRKELAESSATRWWLAERGIDDGIQLYSWHSLHHTAHIMGLREREEW